MNRNLIRLEFGQAIPPSPIHPGTHRRAKYFPKLTKSVIFPCVPRTDSYIPAPFPPSRTPSIFTVEGDFRALFPSFFLTYAYY